MCCGMLFMPHPHLLLCCPHVLALPSCAFAGPITDTGAGRGTGFTLNVPLPPGSGSGAYRAAFDRVVGPALDAYRPQLILVSAGVLPK
jgi:acetoin utilization deacetylase AcuC-like enzyme